MKRAINAVFSSICVLAALSGIAGDVSASPQVGSGLASGRATDADVANLTADLVAFYRAKNSIERMAKRQLVPERDRQKKLGDDVDSDFNIQSLVEEVRAAFEKELVPPGERLATNPAASCEASRKLLEAFVELERQLELTGHHTESKFENPLFVKLLAAEKRRCLEEAFDACMLSGNGAHLSLMMTAVERQFQLIGIDGSEFQAQAIYLMRRCTVYLLRNHSEGQISGPNLRYGYLQDASLTLLLNVNPTDGLQVGPAKEWKGPRAEDTIDVIELATECPSPGVTVEGGKSPGVTARCRVLPAEQPGQARIDLLDMKLYYNETEISNEGTMTIKRKARGEDSLSLSYRPSFVTTLLSMSGLLAVPDVPLPGSLSVFLAAHAKRATETGLVPVTGWKRRGHPVLFETTISESRTIDGVRYTDKTKFELVHRPDRFPADQIVPGWELPIARQPEASRTPAKSQRP